MGRLSVCAGFIRADFNGPVAVRIHAWKCSVRGRRTWAWRDRSATRETKSFDGSACRSASGSREASEPTGDLESCTDRRARFCGMSGVLSDRVLPGDVEFGAAGHPASE